MDQSKQRKCSRYHSKQGKCLVTSELTKNVTDIVTNEIGNVAVNKQAASCEGEGFKRNLENPLYQIRSKSLKLEKFEAGKDRSWKKSTLQKFEVGNVQRIKWR